MALAFDASLGTVTNSGTLTTSAAAASSSRVIMFVWWFGTQTMNATFTTGGLSFVRDHVFRGSGGGDQNTAIASADAPSGLASSTALTPAFSATPDFGPGIAAASFTGVETGASGYVDATSTGKDDFEETWTTNNLVTTLADTLLIAFSATDSTSGHSASAPAAEATPDWVVEGTQRGANVYRIVTSSGTYTIGGVWTGTAGFQQNLGVAYKAAAAGDTHTKAGLGVIGP